LQSSAAEGSAPWRRLQVPNDMAALEPARQAALDFVAGQGLSDRLVFQLELVLEEALMNRLWHAFPDGGRHVTEVILQLLPDALVLQFEDDGVPFDPLQVAEPAPATSLAHARPGGLGLMLTRKAARTLHYERVDGHNRLTVQLARG
jgi:serine/threonine-protein kinase RsbW